MRLPSPPPASPPPLLAQAGVVAFCLLLAGLVARSHLQRDERYGLCMFGTLYLYHLRYEWALAGDETERHRPDRDRLRKWGRFVRDTGKEPRDTTTGIGSQRLMVRAYLRYAWEVEERPAGATALQARLRHQRFAEGPWVEEVLRWPP